MLLLNEEPSSFINCAKLPLPLHQTLPLLIQSLQAQKAMRFHRTILMKTRLLIRSKSLMKKDKTEQT